MYLNKSMVTLIFSHVNYDIGLLMIFFYYCMIVLLCSFNDVFIVEFSCGEWGLFRKMLIILLKNTIHDDQIEISLLDVWSLVFMS